MTTRTGGPPVLLVVHHKPFGFADVELQVIVVAPCDEALNQSSLKMVSTWRRHASHWKSFTGIIHVNIVLTSSSSKKYTQYLLLNSFTNKVFTTYMSLIIRVMNMHFQMHHCEKISYLWFSTVLRTFSLVSPSITRSTHFSDWAEIIFAELTLTDKLMGMMNWKANGGHSCEFTCCLSIKALHKFMSWSVFKL